MAYTGYIYKITNKINGKSYIGKTNDIVRRWKEHRYGHGGTSILSKAFAKYGLDNFEFSIICEHNYHTKEEMNRKLSELEIYYIGVYNTFKKGYNATIGGDGISFYNHSQETIEKIKESNRGKKASEAKKQKISATKLGQHHSSETKEKIRQALLNRDHVIYDKVAAKMKGRHRDHDMIMKAAAKRRKPILQYDMEGNFIKEYKGADFTEFPNGTNISICCKGKTSSAYGYVWRYKVSDDIPLRIMVPKVSSTHKRKVQKYDFAGNLIQEYNSVTDAANSIRVSTGALVNHIKKGNTFKNFYWKYKDNRRNVA